jgi:hypothetical protein
LLSRFSAIVVRGGERERRGLRLRLRRRGLRLRRRGLRLRRRGLRLRRLPRDLSRERDRRLSSRLDLLAGFGAGRDSTRPISSTSSDGSRAPRERERERERERDREPEAGLSLRSTADMSCSPVCASCARRAAMNSSIDDEGEATVCALLLARGAPPRAARRSSSAPRLLARIYS